MPVINVECHLYAYFLRLRIVIHNLFYYICAECQSLGYTKKGHSKIWQISHIVWMFYQYVAGSLTWITTAVSTAPSPSLLCCSSKCQFSFPSLCLLSFAKEKMQLVFLYSFKRCNPGYPSLQFAKEILPSLLAKVADTFGEGEVGCSMHQ